ncbi:MAG: hypothetical protein NT129_06375, partial [Candidatus Aenigmarchaeota archaeon]|nr:hypothetical protein [Candidatus Aenigmarchaeota archaeon]
MQRKSKYAFGTQVDVVETYLFSEKSQEELGKEYGMDTKNISNWSRNKKILTKLALRKKMTYEDIIRLRDDKIQKHNPRYAFETKVEATENYLFISKNLLKIDEKYKANPATVGRWGKKKEVLKEITRRRGMSYEDVVKIRDERLLQRCTIKTKVDAINEYLFGDKSTEEIADDYEIDRKSISYWYNNNKVLSEVARIRKMKLEDVIKKRDEKLSKQKSKFNFETRIYTVEEFLFNNIPMTRIGKKYGTSRKIIARWYENNEVLSKVAQKRKMTLEQIKAIRDEKLAKNKRGGINKLTESNFPKAVENNELLKRAVEVYGSDARSLADIITILYPDQIDRDEAYRLITRPSISQYMGRFLRSGVIPSFDDVKPIVKDVDLDKNKVIHDILLKTGIRYYDSLLGPIPSQKDEQDVLLILQSQIEQEANPSMKKLLEELLKDFKEVYSIRPPGMADRIRRPE